MNDDTPWILVIGALGLAGWLWMKNQNPIADVPYPKGTGSIPANLNPNLIATELYNSMNGAAIFHPHGLEDKETAFRHLLYQNDATVILINNTFNKRYGKLGKGNLYEWIDSEWMALFAHGDIKRDVLDRLTKLGCK